MLNRGNRVNIQTKKHVKSRTVLIETVLTEESREESLYSFSRCGKENIDNFLKQLHILVTKQNSMGFNHMIKTK